MLPETTCGKNSIGIYRSSIALTSLRGETLLNISQCSDLSVHVGRIVMVDGVFRNQFPNRAVKEILFCFSFFFFKRHLR